MSNLISIIDNGLTHHSHSSFKVIVTTADDNSVVFSGNKATKYLLSNLFSGFTNNNSYNHNSGILPPGVRIIGQNYIIFERPPSYQNIFYNTEKVSSNMDDTNVHVFRIPIPWQVYVANFDSNYYLNSVSMFFSPTSLQTKDQPLYLPPLPNFYTDASLCRPMFADMSDIERYPKNLSGVIASAYDWIWNNGTNNDLNEAMVHVNLQIVSRNNSLKDQTIFRNISDSAYASYFHNPFTAYYHSSQVLHLLRSWESISLEDVVNLRWPVSSSERNFPSSYYSSTYSDVSDHPNYYDWLVEWASEYYNDESDEDIEYMIENSEYNSEAYYEYVVNNKISSTPVVFNPLTCQNIIDTFSNNTSSYASVKNKFNSLILNAFQTQDNSQSS